MLLYALSANNDGLNGATVKKNAVLLADKKRGRKRYRLILLLYDIRKRVVTQIKKLSFLSLSSLLSWLLLSVFVS